MIRYECPNGHVFESALTVPCPECDARVTCVPLARLIEQGGEIERLRAELAFTCPRCGAVSHHPMDKRQGYCGRCHDWTGATDETISVTLRRGQWTALLEAARSYERRIPTEQGDGGACLDTIRRAGGHRDNRRYDVSAEYAGPGKYQHYKGGTYNAIGVGEHETTGELLVVYTSDSAEHTAARAARSVDFILRPLNAVDGPDAWNSDVRGAGGEWVPRFRKLAAEIET